MDITSAESSEETQQQAEAVPSRPASNEKFIIIAFIFGAFLGGAAGYLFLSKNAGTAEAAPQVQQGFLEQGRAGKTVEEYINKNLVRQGDSVEVESAGEFSGIYKFKLKINSSVGGQLTADIYSTKDARMLIISVLNTSLPPHEQGKESPAPEQQKTVIESIADDDPVRGDSNAKVTIVEFSDFQCPFCAKAYPTVKQTLETYSGKVRLVYRDFPLSSTHPLAQKAAEASECAEEQGKFWEYHDKLFESQAEWAGKGAEQFKKYAQDLGLDAEKFNACLDSDKYREEVLKDLGDGQKLGVTGTPTFFINGKMLVGAQPFEAFKQIIEEELSK